MGAGQAESRPSWAPYTPYTPVPLPPRVSRNTWSLGLEFGAGGRGQGERPQLWPPQAPRPGSLLLVPPPQVEQMFALTPMDLAGDIDYKSLCYIITHGDEKEE